MILAEHDCPFCGNIYLRTDSVLSIEKVREAYQEHLNINCHPTLEFTIKKILMAAYNVQKDFVA